METTKISANDVKKDLYKSKVNAKFSHYTSGNLYYTVELADGIYQFPIPTVEEIKLNQLDTFYIKDTSKIELDFEEFADLLFVKKEDVFVEAVVTKLSSDLGTTDFSNEMKGSDLNRWIVKAIDKNEFIKIG